jgi:EpsI family protein
MNFIRRNFFMLALMMAASGLAWALAPTHHIADDGQKVDLELMIPKQFGPWHKDLQRTVTIVDPQQKETMEKIYSQTLTRTYADNAGHFIMLSIAYGADQSDSKQLHYPDVCYPAQGFQVLSTSIDAVKTNFGDIRVKRLVTSLGQRSEPLTYWTTVGNKVVVGSTETKLEQLGYGFRGQIPDGLLFRVSSIDHDSRAAYALQGNFVRELVAAVSANDRLKLAGLTGAAGDTGIANSNKATH